MTEQQFKDLETNDFQNRNGTYPKDRIPDVIYYSKSFGISTLNVLFKDTSEKDGIEYCKTKLVPNLTSYIINAYQEGDYVNDWIQVVITKNFNIRN